MNWVKLSAALEGDLPSTSEDAFSKCPNTLKSCKTYFGGAYDILYLHLLNVEEKVKQIMENQCYQLAPLNVGFGRGIAWQRRINKDR